MAPPSYKSVALSGTVVADLDEIRRLDGRDTTNAAIVALAVRKLLQEKKA